MQIFGVWHKFAYVDRGYNKKQMITHTTLSELLLV